MGFSPLDRQLKIEGEGWSKGLQRSGVWLAVQTDSYARAAEGIKETLDIQVSTSRLWRVVQGRGQAVRERQQKQAKETWALPERGQVTTGELRLNKKLGAALDGVFINLREEGWKEVKVGAFFEIKALSTGQKVRRLKRKRRPAPAEDEIRDMVRAEAVSYCAVLGNVDEFEPVQWREAVRRQLPHCWESVVIGDAADWIDRIYADCYYTSQRIVDWYHACEHLGSLARQAFGEGSPAAQRWLAKRKDELWAGQVHTIASAIRYLDVKAEERKREANFFIKHQRAMNYLEFCEQGMPVGSGVVEGGGCKGVIEGRMKRVGMRWSREGAQNMIILRCEHRSGRWQQLWDA